MVSAEQDLLVGRRRGALRRKAVDLVPEATSSSSGSIRGLADNTGSNQSFGSIRGAVDDDDQSTKISTDIVSRTGGNCRSVNTFDKLNLFQEAWSYIESPEDH